MTQRNRSRYLHDRPWERSRNNRFSIWRNQIPYKSQYVEFVDDKFAHAGYNKELKVAEYDDEITCIDDIAT